MATLAYWGVQVGDGVGAGLGAPLLAAVVWGVLVAPKARWPVLIPTRLVIELVVFGAAGAALAVAGQPVLAVVLGVAALATSLFNASQERRARADTQRREVISTPAPPALGRPFNGSSRDKAEEGNARPPGRPAR